MAYMMNLLFIPRLLTDEEIKVLARNHDTINGEGYFRYVHYETELRQKRVCYDIGILDDDFISKFNTSNPALIGTKYVFLTVSEYSSIVTVREIIVTENHVFDGDYELDLDSDDKRIDMLEHSIGLSLDEIKFMINTMTKGEPI